jgi:hypothetical protein
MSRIDQDRIHTPLLSLFGCTLHYTVQWGKIQTHNKGPNIGNVLYSDPNRKILLLDTGPFGNVLYAYTQTQREPSTREVRKFAERARETVEMDGDTGMKYEHRVRKDSVLLHLSLKLSATLFISHIASTRGCLSQHMVNWPFSWSKVLVILYRM